MKDEHKAVLYGGPFLFFWGIGILLEKPDSSLFRLSFAAMVYALLFFTLQILSSFVFYLFPSVTGEAIAQSILAVVYLGFGIAEVLRFRAGKEPLIQPFSKKYIDRLTAE